MFLLEQERPRFLRVRGNIRGADIEKQFSIPVNCDVYDGMIILLPPQKKYVVAEAYDSWQSIALKYGYDEGELKEFNGGVLYPTKRIYLP